MLYNRLGFLYSITRCYSKLHSSIYQNKIRSISHRSTVVFTQADYARELYRSPRHAQVHNNTFYKIFPSYFSTIVQTGQPVIKPNIHSHNNFI